MTATTNLVARNWRDLIKPRSVPMEDVKGNTYAKFVCEPLEPGFGDTLGTALRRVLFSSLQGAAITAIKLDGALHEFTPVPDVIEDVTDIVLNLKEVILLSHSSKTQTVRIEKDGPAVVKASDILVSDQLEVLNPDHVICNVAKGGRFACELTVNVGRGYVSADRNKTATMPIGTVAIDALFSPIRKVNYSVTNARVGQMTDFDKLTLEVVTNGAVKPQDAVAYAAKILKDQLSIFINFEEEEEPVLSDKPSDEPVNEYLFRSVEELKLSVRAANCLANANIHYIGELVQKSDHDMLKTKNFGRKSLKEIKQELDDIGLSLNMKIDSWPTMLERWKQQQNQS